MTLKLERAVEILLEALTNQEDKISQLQRVIDSQAAQLQGLSQTMLAGSQGQADEADRWFADTLERVDRNLAELERCWRQ